MKVSVVMSTRNKADILAITLDSIERQLHKLPFDCEVIVVNDGSTDHTTHVLAKRDFVFAINLDNYGRRNPAIARNVGYRAAFGDIIIAQSDDVFHEHPKSICRLVNDLKPGSFCIATVWNCDKDWKRLQLYIGLHHARPLFFLGSLYRRDLFAIGGNDEEFVRFGGEDCWFGMCLMRGLRLKPVFLDDVLGYHQDHQRPCNNADYEFTTRQFEAKMRAGVYCASGGPWEYYTRYSHDS